MRIHGLDDFTETPATDAFLAEVRASAIPEGYALVPQQIFLEPSDIELICSQCGDGHESGYGDFTDGLLWVGNIQRDDGSWLIQSGVPLSVLQEMGGWESIEMVRRYAHLAPNHLTEHAKQIDSIFSDDVPNMSHMKNKEGIKEA